MHIREWRPAIALAAANILLAIGIAAAALFGHGCGGIPQQAARDAGLLCDADTAAACLDAAGAPRLLGGFYACATCAPAPADRCPLDGVRSGVIEGVPNPLDYRWVCVASCDACDK